MDDPISEMLAEVDTDLVAPERAARYARRWSEGTAEAYLTDIRRAREWWEKDRRTAREASPVRLPDRAGTFMPWDSDRLARYMEHLSERGAAPGTCRRAKAAILAWHRLHGQPVPDGLPASEVLSEHETTLRRSGWTPRRAEPLTLDTLVAILAATDRTRAQGKRDACLILLGYAGMMAAADLAALRIGDVTDCAAGLLVRAETTRTLPHWLIGGQHHTALCPVEAAVVYVRRLLAAGAPTGSPLIRPIDHHDHIAGIDLPRAGRNAGDGTMSGQGVSQLFGGILQRTKIPPTCRYTLGSLRGGGIITRRLTGATVEELAEVSGMSTRSTGLLDYIRTAETWAPASTLALVDGPPREDTP